MILGAEEAHSVFPFFLGKEELKTRLLLIIELWGFKSGVFAALCMGTFARSFGVRDVPRSLLAM